MERPWTSGWGRGTVGDPVRTVHNRPDLFFILLRQFEAEGFRLRFHGPTTGGRC